MKMIDTDVITIRGLASLDACEDCIKWFRSSKLEGLPVKNLESIEGDYNDYIEWLKDKYIHSEYNDDGNLIKYINTNGVGYTLEYDDNGNMIRYKNSNGDEYTLEYDSNGNMIRYEESDGEWYTKEYDDDGNMISHDNSDGECANYRYVKDEDTFKQYTNDDLILTIPLK